LSNHWGGHMLNDVIALLRRDRVFECLGKGRSGRIVLEIVRRAEKDHDCNPDEILEGHGKALGLCYYCLAPATGIVADICRKCRVETGCSEQDLAEWRTRRSSWAIPEKSRGETRGRASRAGRTPERLTRSGRRRPGR
jgi:hypothetical protein